MQNIRTFLKIHEKENPIESEPWTEYLTDNIPVMYYSPNQFGVSYNPVHSHKYFEIM
jgi:hypothetical protein